MTKKQRNKVYKKIYKIIEDKKGVFVCLIFSRFVSWNYTIEDRLEIFKEFELFKPDNIPVEHGWWEYSDRDSRLNALAFCIAMTE